MAARRRLMDVLDRTNACAEACRWAANRRCSRAAYRDCPRGGWLVFLAAALGVDGRKLRAARRARFRMDSGDYCRDPDAFYRAEADLVRSKIAYEDFEAALAKWERKHAARD